MTKEELKEAIAATITENGNKGITGQALANLLNEIVDAAGGLTLKMEVDISTFTMFSGPNEENALVRQKIIEGLEKGVVYPTNIIVDYSFHVPGAVITGDASAFMYDGSMLVFYSFILDGGTTEILLAEDGSITMGQTSGE